MTLIYFFVHKRNNSYETSSLLLPINLRDLPKPIISTNSSLKNNPTFIEALTDPCK